MKPLERLSADFPTTLGLLLIALLVLVTTDTETALHAQDAASAGPELGRPGPDRSGGWDVFEKGFATRSPVAAGITGQHLWFWLTGFFAIKSLRP